MSPRNSLRGCASGSGLMNTNPPQRPVFTLGSECVSSVTFGKSQWHGTSLSVPSSFHDQPWKGHRKLVSPFLGQSSRRRPLWRQALGYAENSRSDEHTSELQSLMRISYAVFCLKTQQQPPSRHRARHWNRQEP